MRLKSLKTNRRVDLRNGNMKADNRRTAKALIASLTPRSKRKMKSKVKSQNRLRLMGIRLRQHKVQRRLQLEASSAGSTVEVDDNETAKAPAAEENMKELICGFAKHNSVVSFARTWGQTAKPKMPILDIWP